MLGIKNVYRDAHCSYADRDLFHSYRRDGESGRMASLIWFTRRMSRLWRPVWPPLPKAPGRNGRLSRIVR